MEFTKALIRGIQPDSPNERDFNISDQGLDRHGSHIYAEGWETKEYMKNPVVMYAHAANHTPDPDLVIGRATKLWFEDTVMASRAKFDVDGEGDSRNVLAIKVLNKINDKFLRATSVGFQPIEHGRGLKENKENPDRWYHRKQTLLEWSVVPVPSNPRALMRNLDDWRQFIDKEGIKGEDLDLYLKSGWEGIPLLYHLDGVDESNYKAVPPIHFHFDMPKITDVVEKENKQIDIVENNLAADLEIRHRYLKLKKV